jgi:hypothetical protein
MRPSGGPEVPGAEPRMGGIALKNGLVLLSESNWAAAIRESSGEISVVSGRKPRLVGSRTRTGRGATSTTGADAGQGMAAGTAAGAGVDAGAEGIPLLRGLGRLGETLLVLAQVKARLPRAELPLESGRVLAALAGSVAANSAVKAFAPKSAFIQEAGGALAAFVPAVLALKGSSITGYHGAEHKVIGGRELAAAARVAPEGAPTRAGGAPERTGADGGGAGGAGPPCAGPRARAGAAKVATKEHDRCGSNLVGPYLLATVATNLLARGRSGVKSPAAAAVAGAVSLGVALEALRWAGKNGDSVLARLMLLPGRTIQKHLTTTEPSADQLEVGERALAELLRLEGVSA